MEAKFNVIKEERKALVKAVSEIVCTEAVYKGAPGFQFSVGGYTIDKNGTITCDEQTTAEDMRYLLTGLAERGFVLEGDIDEIAPVVSEQDEAAADDLTDREVIPDGDDAVDESGAAVDGDVPDKKTITVDGYFPDSVLGNLRSIIASKAALIKKAIGTDNLTVVTIEGTLHFNWFKPDSSEEELAAYKKFVSALCVAAKAQKRVTAKEKPLDEGASEKFAFRCFLLRLNFIGDEFKAARKILLAPMSGNGSHKKGDGKKAVLAEDAAADSGAESEANTEVVVHEEIAKPLKCGECQYHCYYSEGEARSSAGDVLDTSCRELDKYTHYCLKTPSGFRRIKHANDWSGGETAPKWCPLNNGNKAATTADIGVENIEAVSTPEDGYGADSAETGAEVAV